MKEVAIYLGYFVMIISPFLIAVALYNFFDNIDTYESRTDYAHDRIDDILQEVEIISSRVDALEDSKDAGN
jgi:hypothetical protein